MHFFLGVLRVKASKKHVYFNSCGLLITYANNLDLDQTRQNVGPDLDPNSLTLMVNKNEFLEEKLKTKSADEKLLSMQKVKSIYCKVNPGIYVGD